MTFWSDKKILITGGAGFFGSQVVNQLHQKGVATERYPDSSQQRDRSAEMGELCTGGQRL